MLCPKLPSNLNIINFPFLLEMVPGAQFGCSGLKFLTKTGVPIVKVCPLLSQVSYLCCLCGHKASSVVWSFCPMSVSAGDMPFFTALFGVVWYERKNACSISSIVAPPPTLSRVGLNVSTKRSARPLWVVGWSTNMCYATWPAEMVERLRCKLCSIVWD